MNVLVVGGSGFVGSSLCAELLERDHDVTALSRDPESEALPEAVETHAGDVTDYESIESAFESEDAVVNLVALSPLFRPSGGNEMHDRVHRGGTENCLRAAEAHGVDRYVQQSALKADPDADTHYLRAKGQADEAVRASDREWVVVRPSIIFGEGGEFVSFVKRLKRWFAPGLPLYPLPGGGRHARFQPIWIEEFVPMLADAVEDDDHVGETYRIGGPEVLTLREVTDLVFESESESVRIVPLPMGLAKAGLTALGAVGFPMGADQYRGLRFDNTPADNDVAAFGVGEGDLTPFAAYLDVE